MSLQEYIYITISIIYGLAITQLLSKVFKSLRFKQPKITIWPIALWASGVAIILVWFIWIGYQIQSMDGLNYGVFIYLLITAITLYGAVEFSYPNDVNQTDEHPNQLRLSAIFVILYLLIVGAANVALANANWLDTLKLTGTGIVLACCVILNPSWIKWLAPLFLLYALVVHSPLQTWIGLQP